MLCYLSSAPRLSPLSDKVSAGDDCVLARLLDKLIKSVSRQHLQTFVLSLVNSHLLSHPRLGNPRGGRVLLRVKAVSESLMKGTGTVAFYSAENVHPPRLSCAVSVGDRERGMSMVAAQTMTAVLVPSLMTLRR
ncbi:Uncharacterized protein Rs2_44935 [Raphanus sativus]|nr:Uncharacterized protein Rs2_44935 [Raphanus sativus]